MKQRKGDFDGVHKEQAKQLYIHATGNVTGYHSTIFVTFFSTQSHSKVHPYEDLPSKLIKV